MKRMPLLILLLCTISCRDKESKSNAQAKVEKLQTNPQKEIKVLADQPSREFNSLVKILDSLGYKSDTNRVKRLRNYRELQDSKIQMFRKFPFYKIDKEKSEVLWWNTMIKNEADSIDTEIFKTAESVWLYFYQKRENATWVEDGVIEQWKFIDEATTQIGLAKLNSSYPFPYFNTNPYYIANGSYLYIFHTRAMAFSYGQKDIFELFRHVVSVSKK